MKINFLRLLTVMAGFLTILVLTDVSNAQPRRARGKVYTKAEVNKIIDRVEDRVDNFVKNYDRSLDNSSLNGSNKEDWLMKRAKDLESATDELSREFQKRDAWIENKDEVRKCLNIATDIHTNMKNKKYGSVTEGNWNRVVFELNTLAKVYNLPVVGSAAYK